MENQRRNVDLNYILSHSDQTKHQIPNCYDKQPWKIGETYRIRVAHIYDPSKFWIVFKERELNVFQAFLKDFYTRHGDSYKMALDNVRRNMYCVVFTDDAFYRGLIVNLPHKSTSVEKAYVFLFDFGYMAVVKLENLYYLTKKLFDIPQFSVRASLWLVQPYKKFTWDYNVVKRFNELVSGRVLLCILEYTDPIRRIVEITIGDVKEFSTVIDIGDILINEKLAKSIINKTCLETEEKPKGRYLPKTKYPYLFPSFEAIESGSVAASVYTSEMLWQCIARDVLFRPYFSYSGIADK